MDLDEVYGDILPYLVDPKALKDFIETLKDKDKGDLIEEINRKISESDSSFKTDLRIFLNALTKK